MNAVSESRPSSTAPVGPRSDVGVLAAVIVVVVTAAIGALVGRSVDTVLLGVAVGVVVVAVVGVLSRAFGQRWLVGLTRSRPIGPTEHPRLSNLVDGLCLAVGLDPPELRVVDDDSFNAAAISTRPGQGVIIVTRGLATGLDRVELEGVVGVLLARLRSGEAQRSARLALRAGAPVLLAGALWRGAPAFGSACLAVLGPVWGPIMRRAVPPATYLGADVAGALMTRYPPALVSAYEKIRRSSTMTPAAVPGAAHLWIVQPLSGLPTARTLRFAAHPPLDERIALLKEL